MTGRTSTAVSQQEWASVRHSQAHHKHRCPLFLLQTQRAWFIGQSPSSVTAAESPCVLHQRQDLPFQHPRGVLLRPRQCAVWILVCDNNYSHNLLIHSKPI